MTKVKRFKRRLDFHMPNFLVWLLTIQSLTYQLAFALPGQPGDSHESLLYRAMLLTPEIPAVWGVLGVLGTMVGLGGIALRNRLMVKLGGAVQVSLWAFALVCYIRADVYFVGIGVALMQALFWGWFFLKVDKFSDQAFDTDS